MKKAIQKLKCGGKKKFADGGPKGKPDYTGMGIGYMTQTPEQRKNTQRELDRRTIPLDPNTPKYITGVPPIAGIIGKVGQVAKAYRGLNYFRPSEGMMYRGIGKAGAKDAIASRVFRSNPKPGVVTTRTGSGLFTNLPKGAKKVYYAPGERFDIAQKYAKDYIAEVPKNAAPFKQRYLTKNWSQLTTEEIPIVKGRILKKDFLSGYKEVPIKKNGGSVMKSSVQKLKCGGKTKGKKKKFVDGGPTKINTSNIKYPTLAKPIDTKTLAPMNQQQPGDNSTNITPLAQGANFVSGIVGNVLDERKEKLYNDADNREDPSSMMKKGAGLDTGKSLVSGAAKGLAIGGPWGAVAGLAIAGLGRIFGAKKRIEEREAATEAWSGSWSSKTAENIRKTGYKTGGTIKGKGTSKSDSILMKAPEGAFIVPAENADYAEELGRSYLGWDKDEKAKRNYKNGGSTDIKVSNDEVFYTPDEVRILKYHGVNLDELAPKAENKIGKKEGGLIKKKSCKKANGGLVQNLKIGGPVMGFKNGTKDVPVTSDWIHDKTQDLVINEKTHTAYDKAGAEYIFNVDENKYVKLTSGSPTGMSIYQDTVNGPDKEIPAWINNIPELAGAIQAVGGAAGLIAAGKAPNMEVSSTLRKLSGEVRRLSEFGYEPKVINALNAEIENTRRNLSKIVENEGQNSGIEKMAKLNSLLSTTIDKKAGLAFADAAEKSRKWADVVKVDTLKAGQEFDINKIKLDDWYKNQEVFAGLVSAGISNIVGARQLKSEQENLRKIGNSNPVFSPYKK